MSSKYACQDISLHGLESRLHGVDARDMVDEMGWLHAIIHAASQESCSLNEENDPSRGGRGDSKD